MKFDLFIPSADSQALKHVAAGSAVVGTAESGDEVLVDYEGNVYGAVNMVRYADRALIAAGRHSERYPTVARALVSASDLSCVGSYDAVDGIVEVGPERRDALEAWLGVPLSDEELTTSSHHHILVRASRAGQVPPR